MKDLFLTIAEQVKAQFPAFHVQVEEIPDAPNSRLIAVYGVPASEVASVRHLINDLDWNMCQPRGMVALARVVNAETTSEYYPQFSRAKEIEEFDDLITNISARNSNSSAGWQINDIQICSDCDNLAMAA